jgi:hypothetical protein
VVLNGNSGKLAKPLLSYSRSKHQHTYPHTLLKIKQDKVLMVMYADANDG